MRPSLALFTPLEAFAFSALLALACADSELPAEGVGVDEAPRIEKVAGAMSGCESHAECDDGDAVALHAQRHGWLHARWHGRPRLGVAGAVPRSPDRSLRS